MAFDYLDVEPAAGVRHRYVHLCRSRSSRDPCHDRERSLKARPTRRLRITPESHAIMLRRRHSIATCPRNPAMARRRSMNSKPGGNEAGNPHVSGSRCANNSANVGPRPVRRRVCATKTAAARAHDSAVSSPVKSSKTYAQEAGAGESIPLHQIGLGSGPTATISITIARTGLSRDATGCRREGQHTCRSSGGRPGSKDCFVWPPKLCHTD